MIYTYLTPEHASGLDNNYDLLKGDTYKFILGTNFVFSKTFNADLETYYFLGADSKIKVNDKWEALPHSEEITLAGRAQLNYAPYQFMNSWLGIEIPLYNKAVGGLYNYPGRLNTDMVVDFGMHVYY